MPFYENTWVDVMDRYEYKIRVDEINRLISEQKYREAIDIADTVDWREIQNGSVLCKVSDLYKMSRRYEESRDLLLLAYERNPRGSSILYYLTDISVRLGDVVNAIEFYKEYLKVSENDPAGHILWYKIQEAQGVTLEERIQTLELLQKRECKEKWMYELAYLYHRVGLSASCVEECNQVIIYFGEGKYVVKALELKALHEPLPPDQQALYDRLTGRAEEEIKIQDMNVGQYNTIDLQKELANNLKEVLGEEEKPSETTETVLSEPSETAMFTPVTEKEEETVATEVTSTENDLPEVTETPADTSAEISAPDITAKEPSSEEAPKKNTDDITEIVADDMKEIVAQSEPEEEKEEKPAESGNTEKSENSVNTRKELKLDKDTISFGDTLIYKREEIEKALGGSRIMDNVLESAAALNMDKLLSLDGDGQISLVVPDQPMIQKQITGQISIDEVLEEYARIQEENEKKWSDGVRSRIMQETGDLFKNFDASSRDDLLKQLEESVEVNPDSVAYGPNLTEEEVIYLEEELAEQEKEEIIIEEEPQTEVNEKVTSEENESQNELSIEAEIQEEPSNEELSFDRTPYLDLEVKEPEGNEPEPFSDDNTGILPTDAMDSYLEAFAAAGEAKDLEAKIAIEAVEKAEELEAIEAFEKSMDKLAQESLGISISEEEHETEEVQPEEPEALEETVTEEPEAEEVSEEPVKEETVSEESETEEAVTEEPVAKEEAVNEESEAETEVQSEEPETKEAKTEIKEETKEPEETEEKEEPVKQHKVKKNKKTEEAPSETKTVGEFTEAQWNRFESFLQTENMREQVKDAINKITDEAGRGNVIIGSKDEDSALELGKALIVEQSKKGGILGRAAKIKASSLNAKDAFETITKVYGGSIIIQNAEELRKETLDGIKRAIEEADKSLLIILTTSLRHKHRFIMENTDVLKSFDISIDLEALDNQELVRLAKEYALSKEFSIDEMGVLALHTRIEEKQTNSHSVMLGEVKDIIDDAIKHATRKNLGHLFDAVFGKRYDENDMIILGEKDFVEE